MDDRRKMLSEASSVEMSTSSLGADISDNFRPLGLLDDESTDFAKLDQDIPPEHQLGRLLSIRSMFSTISSFAEQQAALEAEPGYRQIGAGACGVIYAQNGKTMVFKLARYDDHQLWNDYLNNTRVWEALARNPEVSDVIHVPQPRFYVPKSEQSWWGKHRDLIPGNHVNLPTAALCIERIFPLPADIRRRLIKAFCAPQIQPRAMESQGNKDCLVRIYLGSRTSRVNGAFFSLRNFKLHLDQML
ncbi:hypothetical protein B0J12DRAFT_411633 [Macrophomina phaseolina]|uniref:Protein kinase domain-containing protein n=1 Tax=Macrophomina phaseolina TaxID=35725 RepID=A0ABQ8GJ56_9PEZI|nr:hypothetical protein B0J12DRAFT_411633 [Macrophomina phaseolina]